VLVWQLYAFATLIRTTRGPEWTFRPTPRYTWTDHGADVPNELAGTTFVDVARTCAGSSRASARPRTHSRGVQQASAPGGGNASAVGSDLDRRSQPHGNGQLRHPVRCSPARGTDLAPRPR